MHDVVNNPKHYNSHASGVECIDVTKNMNFCLGNAFKYIFRHRDKNGLEDLKKAKWYLQRELGDVEPFNRNNSVEQIVDAEISTCAAVALLAAYLAGEEEIREGDRRALLKVAMRMVDELIADGLFQ